MADRNLRIRMLLEAGDRVSKPLRDITQGAGKAAEALKATRDRLDAIGREQKVIERFRDLKTEIAETKPELEAARRRVQLLGREISQTEKPTRALTRDFGKAKAEASALERKLQDAASGVNKMRDEALKAGRDLSRFDVRGAGPGLSNFAKDEVRLRQETIKLTAALKEQEEQIKQTSDRARRFAAGRERFSRAQSMAGNMAASGVGMIGTGVAVAAPLVGAIRDASEYQSVMTDIAQKANLSREESRRMGLALIVAAKAANQFPEEMQKGVDTLAGFGLALPDATKMITPIGRAATAYKAEMADMAAAAFATHDNLKVPVAETQRMIDIMAQAGKSGAFEMKDMAQHFPELTAGYQALGQRGVAAGADIAAALQITRKGTGDSATAATNLSNILQKMASPDTIGNFKKFGVDLPAALKRAYAEGKTPIEAIAELTKKTLGGDLGKIGFLFGDAQVQQGLRPLIQNMEEYRRIRSEALGAKGVTDGDFAERLNDTAEKLKRTQIAGKSLSVVLGAQLEPITNKLSDRVSGLADRVAGWADRHPRLTKGLMIGAAVAAGLFVVLGGGALVIAGLIAPFAALSAAAGFLGIGLLPLAGTALLVVAGIAALAAVAYGVYAAWGPAVSFFRGMWSEIKAGFDGGILGIAAVLYNFSPVGLLYRGFAALMNWLGVSMPSRLTEAGRHLMMGLIRGITGMTPATEQAIGRIADNVVGWFRKKLGIRSPSRVFMGLGGHIVDGLTLGIAAREDQPGRRIARIAGMMEANMKPDAPGRSFGALSAQIAGAIAIGTAAPAAAMPGPAPGAAAAPAAPITIQIYQLPGESGQDLATRIRDILRDEQRGTARASRSSYADDQTWG